MSGGDDWHKDMLQPPYIEESPGIGKFTLARKGQCRELWVGSWRAGGGILGWEEGKIGRSAVGTESDTCVGSLTPFLGSLEYYNPCPVLIRFWS